MEVKDVVDILQELGGKPSYSAIDKDEIEHWYKEVTGKTFVRTSCSDCYHDAVIECIVYLKKHGKMKEKTEYTLKAGVLLQMEFGSRDFYTNANMTDEIAETYLGKYPENIKFFAEYPEDWEAKVNARKKPSIELNEELVSLMLEGLVDGTSDKAILEAFEDYKVNDKKLPKNVLRANLKEALERFANMPEKDVDNESEENPEKKPSEEPTEEQKGLN